MSYLKGAVSLPQTKANGFFSKLISGEEVFANLYEGTSDSLDGIVAFSQALPGDIVGIEVDNVSGVKFNRGSLIAYTTNVEISSKMNWVGFVPFGQQEGVVLPTARCRDGSEKGMVWLSTYGTFELHELTAGEELLIDNGVFLACDADVGYSIKSIGKSFASVIFGGEGFGMAFKGPAKVYTQSRSTIDLAAAIHAMLPRGGI